LAVSGDLHWATAAAAGEAGAAYGLQLTVTAKHQVF
jgi:hypothetical protein